LGGVRGGSVHLLDLKRRPLTAFGVTPHPVILSEAKDLRLSPQKAKMILISGHFERSEKSPPFLFSGESCKGVFSLKFGRLLVVSLLGVTGWSGGNSSQGVTSFIFLTYVYTYV
jgi:hypothetical protein